MTKSEKNIEEICLKDVVEKKLEPLFRFKTKNGTPFCYQSYHPTRFNLKEKPDCKYCSGMNVFVEEPDLPKGYYKVCVYLTKKELNFNEKTKNENK